MRSFLCLFALLFLNLFVKSQNFDSLQTAISKIDNDSVKVQLYVDQIITPLKNNGDFQLAETYYNKASSFTENNNKLQVSLGIVYSEILIAQEKFQAATDLITKLAIKCIESKDIIGQAKCLKQKAFILLSSGEYEKAAELYYEALNKWKENNDLNYLALGYSDLAVINYYLGHFNEAADYWEKSVDAYEITGNKAKLAGDLGNLGLVKIQLGDYYKAEICLKKSLKISIELDNKKNTGNAYTNLSKLEYHKKNFAKAIEYNEQAITIFASINDVAHLSNSYSNAAELYRINKNFEKSLVYINKAFQLESDRDNKSNLKEIYLNRAAIYSDINKHKEAYEDLQHYIEIKDSLMTSENQQAVTELEKKYELHEKEKENQLLSEKIKVKEVESDRQKLAISLIGVVLFVVAVIVFMLVRQNRIKNKINQQLAEKNQIIEDKNKDINDSIQYAKRIQDAILPPLDLISQNFPDSFVLYKPKDIVAGDFYWLEQKGNYVFFAAADCTGHGVPGAMVSVVCATALSRVVKELGITDPGKILDKTRELVIETFEKSGKDVKDGMDISLISLNTSNKEIKWAGANNRLWYSKQNNIVEITADKQPIGKTEEPLPFTTHIISLVKGDCIYLFTDGYADQFGGPHGKKLKYKAFKETLTNNINLPMQEQKTKVDEAFVAWKGKLEQIDDVCVIGIKI